MIRAAYDRRICGTMKSNKPAVFSGPAGEKYHAAGFADDRKSVLLPEERVFWEGHAFMRNQVWMSSFPNQSVRRFIQLKLARVGIIPRRQMDTLVMPRSFAAFSLIWTLLLSSYQVKYRSPFSVV